MCVCVGSRSHISEGKDSTIRVAGLLTSPEPRGCWDSCSWGAGEERAGGPGAPHRELGLYPMVYAEPLSGGLVAHLGSWVEEGPKADNTGVWETT